MKVIEIPFCFYPDPVGGTEIYVESLSRHLQHHGIEVVVSAPARDCSTASYFHNDLRVCRFPQSARGVELAELYGKGDREAAAQFGRILDEEKPDVVHLHAFTSACSLRLVREARRRGIPVLFTYHTPTVSCQRGTLMRWGSEVCDGALDLDGCTACTLHGLGLSRGLAALVGRVPVAVGSAVGSAQLSGSAWTALRMRELVHARHAAFRAFMGEVDHVVAVCDWVRELLLLNGIPEAKITVSRQGLAEDPGTELPEKPQSASTQPGSRALNTGSPIRIAFFGRLDSTKGVHILIEALLRLPERPLALDIYGVAGQDVAGSTYVGRLRSMAAEEPRVRFCSPIPAHEVVRCLRGYDLLAVPSQLLETGPLVVLEAFAAGIPVVGSRLGGISELVKHGVNGLLVEPISTDAWRQVLGRFSEDRELLTRLRAGVLSPRSMTEVAEEMVNIYRTVLGEKVERHEPGQPLCRFYARH